MMTVEELLVALSRMPMKAVVTRLADYAPEIGDYVRQEIEDVILNGEGEVELR